MSTSDPYRATLRDRLAHGLANLALRLATREYRAYVGLVVSLGRREVPGVLLRGDERARRPERIRANPEQYFAEAREKARAEAIRRMERG